MRHVLFVALLAAGCGGAAPTQDPVKDVRETSEAYSTLYRLTSEVGHRLAGTDNGKKAEEFALARFREYGLENVHAESFDHLGWTRGETSFLLYEPRRKMDCCALGNTPTGTVDNEMVSAGHGTPDEVKAAGDTLKGKIVLVMSGAPKGHRGVHRMEKMALLTKAGAAAMVLVNEPAGRIIQTGTVAIGQISRIPAIGITREDGEFLVELIKAGKKPRGKLTVNAKSGNVTSRNIVGEIRGKELANEIVILGAHLDSWDLAVGALDNGVGTAVVLETARAIMASGINKPKRTIRFVLFMAEELGLLGSKAYVKAHEKELGSIVMMINLDMVGKPKGFHLYACDEAVEFFRGIAGKVGVEKVECKAGLHSDHQPFMLAGVAAMTLQAPLDDDQGKYYHSDGDHFGRVKKEQLDTCAKVTVATVLEIANVAKRPTVWLTKDATRERMERDEVKEALQLAGEWPFE